MPVFRNSSVVNFARGFRAFVNLEAGLTRSAGKGVRDENGFPASTTSGGVKPENIVWIFSYGSGRSGTTWLSGMLRDLGNCSLWQSPRVGSLFGEFYYDHPSSKRGQTRREHILGSERETWIRPMRDFILASANARYPQFSRPGEKLEYMVVTEPHGSLGSPLIMEALPESRMILVMRDPRDVAASVLDAGRDGSWANETQKKFGGARSDGDPIARVTNHANGNLESMNKSLEAYNAHEGPKTLLKYEDLRADALAGMRRAVSDLGMRVDDGELSRIVEAHSWENVPKEKKGEGKFYRKASPGGWKEDLTLEEIEIVEDTLAPIIAEFYPSRRDGK